MNAAESFAESTSGRVAFGSMLDLARLQVGSASAQTCDACNTINLQHAHFCKCCAHKLPAFYASSRQGRKENADSALQGRQAPFGTRQTWGLLFAYFSFFLRSLLVVTRIQPAYK